MRNYEREDYTIPHLTVLSTYQSYQQQIMNPKLPKKKKRTKCSKKLPDPPAAENVIAQCSPNTLLNQLESRISTIPTPNKKNIHRCLQQLLKQTPSTPVPIIQSTVAKEATKTFTATIEQVETPVRDEMYHAVKQSVRKMQTPILPNPKGPSPDDPITPFAFRNTHPNSIQDLVRRSVSQNSLWGRMTAQIHTMLLSRQHTGLNAEL